MSTQEEILEKVDVQEEQTPFREIILYNDDVNTFDFVIEARLHRKGFDVLFYIHVALLAVLPSIRLTKPNPYNRWGYILLMLVSGHLSAIVLAICLLRFCYLSAVWLLSGCCLAVS